MTDSDDPNTELNDGKDKFHEGAQKMVRGGLKKGRRNFSYYNRNRSEIFRNMGINNQKAPAVEGLIVLVPVIVVGLVVAWLFSRIDFIPYNELFNITGYYVVDQSVKLAVLIAGLTAISTLTGKAMRSNTGFKLEKTVDKIIGSIPFLGGIYRITKTTTETVINGTSELRRPVKIELSGIKMTAFKTGNKTEDEREILFLPTSPNITTGLILEVNPEQIIETDETAEEALTRALSAGFGQKRRETE